MRRLRIPSLAGIAMGLPGPQAGQLIIPAEPLRADALAVHKLNLTSCCATHPGKVGACMSEMPSGLQWFRSGSSLAVAMQQPTALHGSVALQAGAITLRNPDNTC